MPKIKQKVVDNRKQRKRMVWIISILLFFFIAAMIRIGVGEAEWAGMTVSNLTPTLGVEFNIPESEYGVVVNWVEEQGYYSGVREGDLIKSINRIEVKNIKEFLRVAHSVDLRQGALLDILRDREPIFITLLNKHGLHTQLKEALNLDSGLSGTVHAKGDVQSKTAMQQVALGRAVVDLTTTGGLPTPKQQNASKKILVEGHWLGMELIPLTPELAKEYNIDPATKGLLVDEISLEAAETGILAGDMVMAVAGISTPDLVSFTNATRRVKNKLQAEVLAIRRGKNLKIMFKADKPIGFSQNEAAQPIQPGAISPHKNRNKPCTSCHIIMNNGGQLATDAGDILPSPPPITKNAVAPHRFRGACKTCHVILKK